MKKTKFNWTCMECNKRNIEIIEFQFDVPKAYEVEVICSKCGKTSVINIYLSISFM